MKYILILLFGLFLSCNNQPRCGVVTEKFVLADRYGLPNYRIIVKYDDGDYFDMIVSVREYGKLQVGKRYCW